MEDQTQLRITKTNTLKVLMKSGNEEEFLSNSQFWFRRGFGTRQALFSLQMQKPVTRDVGVALIDYEKAFREKMRQNKLHM